MNTRRKKINKTKRTNKTRKMRKTRKTRKTRRMRRMRRMRGGNGAPSPFVGSPYDAGAASPVGGMPSGNHYSYNTKVNAWPESSNPLFEGSSSSQSQQIGGRSKKNYRTKQKGGGNIGSFLSSLVPNDILNITRSVPAAVGHMYDKFNGVSSLPSSMVYPTDQPLVPDVATDRMMTPPNIVKFYSDNNSLVSGL